MGCSTFQTITRHNTPNISELEDQLRTNNFLGPPTNDRTGCFSNFSYTNWPEATKFENSGQPSIGPHHFD